MNRKYGYWPLKSSWWRRPSFRNPIPDHSILRERAKRYRQWLETRNPELIP